jgi:hypothetical protein
VLAHVGDRALDVDDLRRPGRPGTEAVVDVEAHPAVGGQVREKRDALLVPRADHPAAAVHLNDRRPRPPRRLLRQVDIELQPQAPAARVLHAANPSDARPPDDEEGKGDLDAGVGRLGLRGVELLAHLAEVEHRPARLDYARHGHRRGHQQPAEPDPAGRVIEPAERDQDGGGHHVEHDQERRQLDRHPGEHPAREREGDVGHRAQRVDHAD